MNRVSDDLYLPGEEAYDVYLENIKLAPQIFTRLTFSDVFVDVLEDVVYEEIG